MNGNPFYVRPASIDPKTLAGLAGVVKERRARQAQEQAQQEELERRAQARAAVRDAYRSNDPQKIAEIMIQYPEASKNLGSAMKFKSDATKNRLITDSRAIMMNPERTEEIIQRRIEFLNAQGADTTESETLLEAYRNDPEGFAKQNEMVYAAYDPKGYQAMQKASGRGAGGMASAVSKILPDGTSVQVRPSGQTVVTDPEGNVVTGKDRVKAIRQARQFGIEQERQEAGIAVERARGVAAAQGRESRISELRKELSTRNRNARREEVRISQALKAAGDATQGLSGSAKMILAKLFPGIDVTNEALLDQSLKDLAISQLENFKGPTTDFEFEQVERATGALGDPETANIARLKALQRANWFRQREFEQFKKFVKEGGDPDEFGFDFEEKIKIKGGTKEASLRDIQDTAAANNMTIEEVLERLK